jgi:hypothetical protein
MRKLRDANLDRAGSTPAFCRPKRRTVLSIETTDMRHRHGSALLLACAALALAARPTNVPDVLAPGQKSLRGRFAIRCSDKVRTRCAVGHEVRAGDTLVAIATRELGDARFATDLAAWNDVDPQQLQPGDRIWIPPRPTDGGALRAPEFALVQAGYVDDDLRPFVPTTDAETIDAGFSDEFGDHYGVRIVAVPWNERASALAETQDEHGHRSLAHPFVGLNRPRSTSRTDPTETLVVEYVLTDLVDGAPSVVAVARHHFDASGRPLDPTTHRVYRLAVALGVFLLGLGMLAFWLRRRGRKAS